MFQYKFLNKEVMLNLFQHPFHLWSNSLYKQLDPGSTPGMTTRTHSPNPGYMARTWALKSGFTLIELLVVVLIIGILAAVALPQYDVAVAKTRTASLLALTRAIDLAQQRVLLATGGYTTNLDDLDIEMPAGGTRNGLARMEYPDFVCYLRGGTDGGLDASVYCNDIKSGARLEKYYQSPNFICWTKQGTPPDSDISVKVCQSLSGGAERGTSGQGNGYSYAF